MKNNKTLITATFIGFALVALPVFAEGIAVSGATTTPSVGVISGGVNNLPKMGIPHVFIREKKDDMRDVRMMRQDIEKEMKERKIEGRIASSSDVRVMKEIMEKEMRMKVASSSDNMMFRREEIKQKFEDEKVRLGGKLKTIKDERKRNMVKKVNEQFQEINTKKLEHFSNALKQMEEVLLKIKTRAAKASAGADTSTLNTKIATFETAVTVARAAIVAQSAKIYSIEITTEDNLKNNTGVTRQALQADLKTVFDLVKNAHESLKDIMKELSNVRATTTTTATTTVN